MVAMKRLLSCLSLVEAQHCANVLASAGVHVEVRNTFLGGAVGDIPFLEAGPQVWIEASQDVAYAQQLIAEAAAPLPSPAWRCAACGEESEAQFAQCWRCGALRP